MVGIPIFVKRFRKPSRLLVPAFHLAKVIGRECAQGIDCDFFVLRVCHHSPQQAQPGLAEFGQMRKPNDRKISQLISIQRINVRKSDVGIARPDMLMSLDDGPHQQ